MTANAERAIAAAARQLSAQVSAQVAHTAASDLTQADLTKLDGIETGATANATNAQLRDRATHTGTQLASTISDFAATVLATVLTGLSLATGTAITAADTVLSAMGKLQKQITDVIASVALKAPLASPTFTGIATSPKFLTDTATVNAANSVATTIYTLANQAPACWLVHAHIGTTNDTANFDAFAVVLSDGTAARIALGNNGALHTITLSGLNIQSTQGSGASQNITVNVTRVG